MDDGLRHFFLQVSCVLFSPKAKASDLLPTPSARIFRDAFEYRGAPPDSERRRRLDTTSSEFV
jgi:hypothetical protein